MSNTPREPVMVALKAFLRELLPDFNTVSRRLRSPDSIKATDCPAIMIDEVSELVQQPGQRPVSKTILSVNLWVVLKNGGDQDNEPIIALNNLLDRIDGALRPQPCSDSFTLGGLCEYCRIEGSIEKDGGEIGKIAAAIVPLKILIP